MSNAVKSSIVPFVIPRSGMSTQFPIAEMPPQFSPWIRDLDNEGGYFEVRKGVKWKFNAAINYISALIAHPTDKNKVLYMDTSATDFLRSYDAVSGATASIGALALTPTGVRSRPIGFNKNVFFFFTGCEPVKYDGATYGVTTITGPTLANLVFGFIYRNRIHVVEANSTKVWCSGEARGIGGAFIDFDFGSLTEDSGVIVCGFGFTLSDGTNSQLIYGIVFDTGEILFYTGAYFKDDLWKILGTASIGAPLGYQSIIKLNGDQLVITKNGIVSMRTLLTTAQGDVGAASITAPIEKYWCALIEAIQANETLTSWNPDSSLISYINGSYHQQRNKLVIFVPGLLFPYETEDKSFGYQYEQIPGALIYDIPTKSWQVHVLDFFADGFPFQFISSYYWKTFNMLLFGTNSTGGPGGEAAWQYWGNNNYYDKVLSASQSQAINPELHTTFAELEYQSRVSEVFVNQEGPYCKSRAEVTVVVDSGAQHTEAAKCESAGDTAQRSKYSVGAIGNSVQIKIKSITDPAGSMTRPYRIANISALIEQQKGVF